MKFVLLTDRTGSMGSFLRGIASASKEVMMIVRLLDLEAGIGAFEDYCDGDRLWGFTGFHNSYDGVIEAFCQSHLSIGGGGDAPEAHKTALNNLLKEVIQSRKVGQVAGLNGNENENENKTVVFLYTDAPPHHLTNRTNGRGSNYNKEVDAIRRSKDEFDWFRLSQKLYNNNIVVYPIINRNDFNTASFYVMLSEITGGQCFHLNTSDSKTISLMTINLLLGLLGAEHNLPRGVLELKYSKEMISIIDENNSSGYLPPLRLRDRINIISQNSQIRVVEYTNLSNNIRRFKIEPEFKDIVFNIFNRLIEPNTIISLSTNAIFGKFWREICKCRDDPRHHNIINKFSRTIDLLVGDNKKIMQEWIDESYNNVDNILEEINAIGQKVPAIVLDINLSNPNESFTVKEILEITRSCAPPILRKVSQLITNLRIVEREEDLPEFYLPLALSSKRIFALLPHLISPGIEFSHRASIIMATISVITNSAILKDRAQRFLEWSKGKWFQDDVPENFSASFMYLMLKYKDALTNEEIAIFTKLKNILGLVLNRKSSIRVKIPFSPSMNDIHKDHKIKCISCNHMRSFTLITEDERCGLCHFDHGDSPESTKDDESNYVECHTCNSLYAVIKTGDLNVRPKCHYCRNNISPVPTILCTCCRNRYIYPGSRPVTLNPA